MQCEKCNSDLPSESKFCNNCGEKVEESELSELIKSTNNYWFLLGFVYGMKLKNKPLKKYLDDKYKEFDKYNCKLFDDYKETINFVRNYLLGDDKKPQKNKSKKF